MENKYTLNAWMAGFVDGEGCLTISKQIRKGRPSPAYRTAISVTNTSRESIEIFQKKYGGSIYSVHEKRKDKRKIKWADAYSWRCIVSKTVKFINDILPYLRIKDKQARIILEFIKTKDGFKRGKRPVGKKGGSAPLTQQEINHRESLRNQIQKLNTKGQNSRRGVIQSKT